MASAHPTTTVAPRQESPVKTSPASLPFELFLNIVDILVAEAEADDRSVLWEIDYHRDAPTKLTVRTRGYLIGSPSFEMTLRERFQSIRIVSQINRKTRSMIQSKFRRFPLKEGKAWDGPIAPVDAWVRPEIDFFTPAFRDAEGFRAAFEIRCAHAIQLPTAEGDALLRCVQHLFFPTLRYWQTNNLIGVGALSTLTNLKSVGIIAGYTVPICEDEDLEAIHPGWMPIEPHRYPELWDWGRKHGRAFRKMWAPFEKRGVELYAFGDDIKPRVMDMVMKKAGFRVKHLFPTCKCCTRARS